MTFFSKKDKSAHHNDLHIPLNPGDNQPVPNMENAHTPLAEPSGHAQPATMSDTADPKEVVPLETASAASAESAPPALEARAALEANAAAQTDSAAEALQRIQMPAYDAQRHSVESTATSLRDAQSTLPHHLDGVQSDYGGMRSGSSHPRTSSSVNSPATDPHGSRLQTVDGQYITSHPGGGPPYWDSNVDKILNDGERVIELSPTARYAKLNTILGKGAYKVVYKAIDREEGYEVAWNCFQTSRQEYSELSQEIEILKRVRHPNIINFHDCWYNNTEYIFVTELMTSGTLRECVFSFLLKLSTARC